MTLPEFIEIMELELRAFADEWEDGAASDPPDFPWELEALTEWEEEFIRYLDRSYY